MRLRDLKKVIAIIEKDCTGKDSDLADIRFRDRDDNSFSDIVGIEQEFGMKVDNDSEVADHDNISSFEIILE